MFIVFIVSIVCSIDLVPLELPNLAGIDAGPLLGTTTASGGINFPFLSFLYLLKQATESIGVHA